MPCAAGNICEQRDSSGETRSQRESAPHSCFPVRPRVLRVPSHLTWLLVRNQTSLMQGLSLGCRFHPGILLSPLFQCWNYKRVPPHLAWYIGAGVRGNLRPLYLWLSHRNSVLKPTLCQKCPQDAGSSGGLFPTLVDYGVPRLASAPSSKSSEVLPGAWRCLEFTDAA